VIGLEEDVVTVRCMTGRKPGRWIRMERLPNALPRSMGMVPGRELRTAIPVQAEWDRCQRRYRTREDREPGEADANERTIPQWLLDLRSAIQTATNEHWDGRNATHTDGSIARRAGPIFIGIHPSKRRPPPLLSCGSGSVN